MTQIEELEVCDCRYCNDGREHWNYTNRTIHWCEAHGEYISDIGICPGCRTYERRVGE